MEDTTFDSLDFSRSFAYIQNEINKIITKSDTKIQEWLNKKELIIQLATEIVDDLETQNDFRSYVYWLYYQLKSDIFVADVLNYQGIQARYDVKHNKINRTTPIEWEPMSSLIVQAIIDIHDIENKELRNTVRRSLNKARRKYVDWNTQDEGTDLDRFADIPHFCHYVFYELRQYIE